jgi:8-oxo-dGTP diphosphatase
LKPADDAKGAGVFSENDLPEPIVFDHRKIIGDYFRYKEGASKREVFSLNLDTA